MRAVLIGLSALAVCLANSGCIVATSTQHNLWSKSAVVVEDEIYVVDLKKHTARPVTVVRCEETETTEVITIESQTETGQ